MGGVQRLSLDAVSEISNPLVGGSNPSGRAIKSLSARGGASAMNVKRLFYWLLGLALVTTVFVQGLYLYKFGLAGSSLSSNASDWGEYGDYLGGTLGTYFGFLAFIGVLFTVVLQSQQLDHSRKQSKLDEIQRFVAHAASKADAFLQQPPKNPPEKLKWMLQGRELPQSIHDLLFAAVNLHFGHRGAIPEEAAPAVLEDLMTCLRRETAIIVIELQHLAGALDVYAAHDGSPEIAALYKDRYKTEVGGLQLLGLLSSERVASYFDSQAMSELMRASWKTLRHD